MKDPEKILDAFKTLSDDAARQIADLRNARDKALKDQVATLVSIETAFNESRAGRDAAKAASGYAQRALAQAKMLRMAAEKLAEQEVRAHDVLLDRFADQKRFELYLSQRQLKEKALTRRREEKKLVDQLNHLSGQIDFDEDA